MNWWEQLDGPLLGRYRIERVLGEGGMARVFVATDLKFNRQVAIKTPKLESFPPDRVEELLKRFNREFRSQAEDPIHGVIPVYDAGEVVDAQGVSRPLLVMQYLTGGSLAQRLGGRVGARAHRQTLAEVLEWLPPIATAIDSVHQRRFLHRDIKPDNILFNRDERPFLADFGVVGMLDTDMGLDSSTLGPGATGASQPPGSPGYQSPESIQADAIARKSPASDQFSLAVTVYEALSGLLPVQVGTSAQWYGALINWTPTSLAEHCPELPRAAVAAVMKAMSAKSSDRFLSCSEFAKALAASVPVQPSTPPSAPQARESSAPAEPPSARAAAMADALSRPTPTPPVVRPSRVGMIALGVLVLGVLATALMVNLVGRVTEPSKHDAGPSAEVSDRTLSDAVNAWVQASDAAESGSTAAFLDSAEASRSDRAPALMQKSYDSALVEVQRVSDQETAAARVLDLVLARTPDGQGRARLLLLALAARNSLAKERLDNPTDSRTGLIGRSESEAQRYQAGRETAIRLAGGNFLRLQAATKQPLAIDPAPSALRHLRADALFEVHHDSRLQLVLDGLGNALPGMCVEEYLLRPSSSAPGSLETVWRRACPDLDMTIEESGSMRLDAQGEMGQVKATIHLMPAGCARADGSECQHFKSESRIEEHAVLSLVTPDVLVVGYGLGDDGKPTQFRVLLRAAAGTGDSTIPADASTTTGGAPAPAEPSPASQASLVASSTSLQAEMMRVGNGDTISPVPAQGAAMEAACAHLDGDKDGVDDCTDLCPATLATSQETRGCQLDSSKIAYFDFDSSTLTPEAVASLGEVVAALKGRPELHLLIFGHADRRDSDRISDRRANAVASYLEGQGVDRSRILDVLGLAPSPSAGSADDEATWAGERRVEVLLVK